MIYIPFIWFVLLFAFIYKRNKCVDIAGFIVILFGVSSFFSILTEYYGLLPSYVINHKISLESTIVYCSLITLCVSPFIRYSSSNAKLVVPLINNELLIKIAWISLIVFVLHFSMSFYDILYVFSNMDDVRNAHYAGDDTSSWLADYPFILRLPFIIYGLLVACSWILIFCGFISYTVQKLPFKYCLMFFVGSLNQLIGSIMIAGRAGFAYWILSFLACFVFFWPIFTKKQKRVSSFLMIIFTSALFIYLNSITIARFSDFQAGQLDASQGSIIDYLGKPFVNFSYFYDTYICPEPTLQIIFPFIYRIMGSEFEGGVEIQQHLSLISGKDLGTFYTFIGQIFTTSSKLIAVIYCICFTVLSNYIIRKKRVVVNVRYCYCYIAASSILFLGLFGHYYSTYSLTFSLFAFYFIIMLMERKLTRERNKFN